MPRLCTAAAGGLLQTLRGLLSLFPGSSKTFQGRSVLVEVLILVLGRLIKSSFWSRVE